MTDDIKPRMLKQVTTGRVYMWTKALSARKDMVPTDTNLPAPQEKPMPTESKEGELRALLAEKDKIILDLQRKLDEMAKAAIEQNDIATLFEPVAAIEPPAATSSDRMKIITAGTQKIVNEDDRNNFTAMGKVRIEPLEIITGLTDITAQERDEAFEACK